MKNINPQAEYYYNELPSYNIQRELDRISKNSVILNVEVSSPVGASSGYRAMMVLSVPRNKYTQPSAVGTDGPRRNADDPGVRA